MTEDWAAFNSILGTGWYNTEYRTYEFLPLVDTLHPTYPIKEIEWSVKRREAEKQENKPLGKAEQEFETTVVSGEEVEVPLN